MFERPEERPAANPLGLSLGFFEGEAYVTLRDRKVADGVVIRALDLALAEVGLPVDLEGRGAEAFQRRSTRLRGLVLDIHLDLICSALAPSLAESAFSDLRLDVEGGQVTAELEVNAEEHRATLAAVLTVGPGPHRSLRGYMAPPASIGFSPIVPRRVMGVLIEAGRRALTQLSPQSARSLKRVGGGGLSLDPVDALMWAVMPVNGWKVPEHEDVPLRGVSVTPAGFLRIVVGQVRSDDEGLEPDAQTQTDLEALVTSSLVREEASGLAVLRDDDYRDGAVESVFRNLAAALDPEQEALAATVMSTGASQPALHPELVDHAERLLDARPQVAGRAYLALAAIDQVEGRETEQRGRLVQAARCFRESGLRRWSGLCLRAAADLSPAEERARLLEETIAVRADDVRALAALVDVLPTLGRAPAAVRAARRLAHLSPDRDEKIRAHLFAAALLRDEMGDLHQARRELERARKLDPDHAEIVEAIAVTAAADGDRAEGTRMLSELAEETVRAGHPERAADLWLRAGGLWAQDEPAVALEHFQRAAELTPDRVAPLAAIAQAARRSGQVQLEQEAVLRARPHLTTGEHEEPAAVLEIRRAAAAIASASEPGSAEAVEHLQEALRLAPDDLETLEALGRLHAQRGEHREQARVFGRQAGRAVADGRWEEAAKLFVAQAEVSDEDAASVRSDVVTALQSCPGHRGLLDALLAVSETPRDRIDALERRMVLEDSPSVRAGQWVARGEALEAAGRSADAARAYEEALQTGISSEQAMQALLRIHRDRDEPERLADVYRRVAATAKKSEERVEALYERARLLTRVGRDDEAYASLEEAFDISTPSLAALGLATKLAVGIGRFAAARDHADARLRLLGSTEDPERLEALLDRADVGQKTEDLDLQIESLNAARDQVDPSSSEGRQIAARLARVLARGERLAPLAELERERGRVETVPPGERAERLLAAARLAIRLEDDEAASADIEQALAQIDTGSVDPVTRAAALELQEALARRRGDPLAMAEVVGRRAAAALERDEQVRLRLEQVGILEDAGRQVDAVRILVEARREQPDAFVLAERLGGAAERAKMVSEAAEAFADAARLAKRDGKPSLHLHGRAAAAFMAAGEHDAANVHDRAVLTAVEAEDRNGWTDAALDRLESRARARDDAELLVDVLSRRMDGAAPKVAAQLLLERAGLEVERLGRDRDALDDLRRARTLAPEGSEIALLVGAALTERLHELGYDAERAAVLAEQADRVTAPHERVALLVEAARAQAEALDDLPGALSRVQTALQIDASHRAARALRLALLRRLERTEALAEALAEDAEQAEQARELEVAADMWTEAAELTSPMKGSASANDKPDRSRVERALSLVRRASRAAPGSMRAVEATVHYARLLGRDDLELLALAALADGVNDAAERGRIRLGRAYLLEARAQDTRLAHDDLLRAYDDLKGLTLERAGVAVSGIDENVKTWLALDDHDDPVVAILSKGLSTSRQLEAWTSHLRVLEGLIHRAADVGVMAELYTVAGDVYAEQLLDAPPAEAAYRSANRLAPEHQRSQDKLRRMLVEQERYGDIADALGLDALVDLRREIEARLTPESRRHLLSAVVERLSMDGEARAEASIALARLELADPEAAAVGVARLQRLVRFDQRADEALNTLLAYFDATEDAEAYCEALRLRADRKQGVARAEALTKLAEAFDVRMRDAWAAERELVAALDAEPGFEPAKSALTRRWLADERYEDLADTMGHEILAEPVQRLLDEGPPARGRAFRAAAAWIAAHPKQDRTDLWLDIAEAFDARAGGQDDGLLELLRMQVDKATAPEDRQGVLLALAERLMLQVEAGHGQIDAAEGALRAVLEIDPEQADARSYLLRLYESERRYLDIGRVLGRGVLEELRSRAEVRQDGVAARRATEALAQLAEGPQRAELLLALVPDAHEVATATGSMARVEGLYRAALAADPANSQAQDGFRELLAREGRFRDIGELLGLDALRGVIADVEGSENIESLLPAVLSLIDLIREDPNAVEECTALWAKAAELHRREDDVDAAEYALRMVLANQGDHSQARDMLRSVLVEQNRLAELAHVDASLLAEAVTDAEVAGDVDFQVRGLRVLAEHGPTVDRAELLTTVASLELERERTQSAEADLLSALKADRDHPRARALLEDLHWSSGRFVQAARFLGDGAFMARASRELQRNPNTAIRALTAVAEDMPVETRGPAFEMLGATSDPTVEPEQDRARRLHDLTQAKLTFDAANDAVGGARVRLALVALRRDDADHDARLVSLDEAIAFVSPGEVRGALMLEQAALLEQIEYSGRALIVAQQLLDDEEAGAVVRDEAARLLVDRLEPSERVRTYALQRLVKSQLGDPGDRSRWRLALARIREDSGADAETVAALLEAALPDVRELDEQLDLRRRLLSLYDELGDWAAAERQAAVLADAEGTPEQWVTLSELRMWLDDRAGAKTALERAIERAPGSRPAHESLIRMAEQEGAPASVMARLEAWADADTEGTSIERAERLLHAAKLAVDAHDADRAFDLAGRAIALVEPSDPAMGTLSTRAERTLIPLGRAADRADFLAAALSSLPAGQGAELRLRLSSLLGELDRIDEAADVLEEGLVPELAEDDPLVVRFMEEAVHLGPTSGARRLFVAADRLGSGPAARRFRRTGAELAEAGGDKSSALSAWSRVGRDVGSADDAARARAARIRLARDLDDPSELLEALTEAAQDTDDDSERAARYAEAAELAEIRLQEPSRAEQLLRRAIQAAEDPAILQDTLLDLLRRHERWATLENELDGLAKVRSGPSRAGLLAQRGEVLRRHLHDQIGAAALFVDAYRADPAPDRGAEAAAALERAGDLESAEALLETVLKEVSPGGPAWLRVALVTAELLERAGRIDDAIKSLERTAEAVPGAGLVAVRRRQLLLRHERWSELADLLLQDLPGTRPIDRIRNRLAAARILLVRAHSHDRAIAALRSALRIVQGWLANPERPMPDHVVPLPQSGGSPSVEMTLDSPLLDLAHLAAQLGQSRLRVDALRLFAQSVPAGAAQRRALLLLAAAERETGDLDAAEFTLRGAVQAIRSDPEAEFADLIEAERSLGVLLLDRGAAHDAVEVLSRAEAMLRGRGQAGDTARAQILVRLADAYRAANRPAEAVTALQEARLLDDREVSEAGLEAAIESAGPSEALAALLQKRAGALKDPHGRATMLRDSANIWEQLGRNDRALMPLLEAYECDTGNGPEARRLQELLYQAERWPDLASLLGRRLDIEVLDATERVALLMTRARLLDDPLGHPQAALRLLEEAARLQPSSIDVLDALCEQAAAVGRLDLHQQALSRLAAASTDPTRVLRALLHRAVVLERMDDVEQASHILEDALERSFALGSSSRPIIDHLARLYSVRGLRAAEARLWVRVAAQTEGPQAATFLARAVDIRAEALADRRGALAVAEAAIRAQPDELSLRWAVIQLALSLGDDRKALSHATVAAKLAAAIGQARARRAFLKWAARTAARLGDTEAELAAWVDAIATDHLEGHDLAEVIDRTAAASVISDRLAPPDGLPPELIAQALEDSVPRMSGPARGQYRFARARVLEERLGRSDEAAVLKTLAWDEDGVESLHDDLIGAAQEIGPGEPSDPSARALLDRSGRWGELAAAESARAAGRSSRPERAQILIDAGRRLLEASQPDMSRARQLFDEALGVCPDQVVAWAERARLDLRNGDVHGANEALEALRHLGGAPWAPPELELAVARVKLSMGERASAMTAFAQAKLQDPTHREAAAGLAELAERLPDRQGAQRWFDDYRRLLDETLDTTALVQLCFADARQAHLAGDSERALRTVTRALELRPRHHEARRLRLDILREFGDSPFLLDALTTEAGAATDADEARRRQELAFELARRLGDRRRGLVLAETIEARADDNPDVLMLLYGFYREHGDRAGLLRVTDKIGGIDALGPLPREQRILLAAACFQADRPADAFTLLVEALPSDWSPERYDEDIEGFIEDLAASFGVPNLSEPGHQVALRRVLADLPPDALSSSSVRLALEALVVWQPEARTARRLLAGAYRRSDAVEDPKAVDLYRGLLAEDPGDADLLAGLSSFLPNRVGMGPRAILQWIEDGPALRHPWPTARPADPSYFERVRHPAVRGPLGVLLRLSASALAGVLPPSERGGGLRRPAHEDPRLAEVAQAVRSVMQVPLTVVVDAEGGENVSIEPGDPCKLVVGEALAEDRDPAEVRFHLARAAMLVELGFLLTERAIGVERRHYVTLVAAAVDVRYEEGLPASYRSAVELMRGRLDPMDRAAAEAAILQLNLEDLPIAAWIRGAMQTADRFGTLMAGVPAAALRALHRMDPRTMAEPIATREDRVRAIRRWRPLREVVAFVVSDAYPGLVDGNGDPEQTGRAAELDDRGETDLVEVHDGL